MTVTHRVPPMPNPLASCLDSDHGGRPVTLYCNTNMGTDANTGLNLNLSIAEGGQVVVSEHMTTHSLATDQ